MKNPYSSHPNPIVRYLRKPSVQFRRDDLMDYVRYNGIRMINFMYPAADNRLKTLNFIINSEEHLRDILTFGERVDGSSLFPFIEAGNSDLYVIPRYSTAFLDPFAEIPTLTLLASFFNKDGLPLESSPEYTLRKACDTFRIATHMDFYAMGELEYYVVAPATSAFHAEDQKGYHESSPFARFNDFRTHCMALIASTGAQIKYGHNEVGNFSMHDKIYEQNEIEFLPVTATDAADHLMLAKWIIRTLASRMNLDVTFAPKITSGKAGSGLHIHFKIMKDDINMMTDSDGTLSCVARKAIAGILDLAPAITAFGNKIPTSYFRLVPHQEAPTSVCWGDRNRSVLIRVPLGWNGKGNMCAIANPLEADESPLPTQKQTAELRSSDCSADIYQLMAAMAIGARRGITSPDALTRAQQLYVDINIHSPQATEKIASLASLPASCVESAAALRSMRAAFEAESVFAPEMIDGTISRLEAFNDSNLRAQTEARPELLNDLVTQFWNCG